MTCARRPTPCPPCALRGNSSNYASPCLEAVTRSCRFAEHAADLHAEEGEFLSAIAAREDGAVMAVVEEMASRRQMLLACCHLFWNPKAPDVKAAQASLLVKQVRRGIRSRVLVAAVHSRLTHGVHPCARLSGFCTCRSSASVTSTGYQKRDRCYWEATSTVRQGLPCQNLVWFGACQSVRKLISTRRHRSGQEVEVRYLRCRTRRTIHHERCLRAALHRKAARQQCRPSITTQKRFLLRGAHDSQSQSKSASSRSVKA